jgi:hypothetical protein
MDKERYLFLDFDGVLNTMEYQAVLQWRGEPMKDQYGSLFDPCAIENLNLIIEQTAAKIVISSSWRLDGIKRMREMWATRGLPGEVCGVTPALNQVCFNSLEEKRNSISVIPYGTRGLEINEWIRTNHDIYQRYVGYSYVIIDDFDDFISSQMPHVVLTEPETGLTKEIAGKVISLLL